MIYLKAKLFLSDTNNSETENRKQKTENRQQITDNR